MLEDSIAREGDGAAVNAWLEREELILNHLKATAVLLRLGYWVLRILLLLVALIALVGGGIKGKLSYVLAGLLLAALAFRLFRREYNSSHDSARAEVEAAIHAVRAEKALPFRRNMRRTRRNCASPCCAQPAGRWRYWRDFCSFARRFSLERRSSSWFLY